MYKNLVVKSYIGPENGTRMQDASFLAEEGVKQGNILAVFLFCLALDRANLPTDLELQSKGEFLGSGIDDTYLVGPKEVVFAALLRHKQCLKELGLELHLGKTRCYIREGYRDAEFEMYRGNIEIGYMETIEGVKEYGLKVYGVPMGSERYINISLEYKANKIMSDFNLIEMKLGAHHLSAPEIPSKQCLWQLILRCLQFKGNYWARHLPLHMTTSFCHIFDKGIQKLTKVAVEVDFDSLSNFNKERYRLPIRKQGLGVRDLSTHRNEEYIGGVHQGIIPLLDHSVGNNIKKCGHINTEAIKRMFGSESFVYNESNESQHPWLHVLTRYPNSLHARGLREAWNNISSEARRLDEGSNNEVPITQILTFLPTSQAGFTPKIISGALEKARYNTMKDNIKQHNSTLFSPTDCECLVMLNSDTLSSQFLTALPNATGIIPDKIIIEVFAHYMSLPSPAMKPFNATTHYIGRDGQQVDQYGDAVARAKLCGGDWQHSHYDLQYLLADIMQKGSLLVDVEAQNMFSNIVPEDVHREYQRSHTRKDAIIPDMLVHNYLPDVNANGKCSMPAIFDVNTLRVDKNLVVYNEGKGGKKVIRAVKKE